LLNIPLLWYRNHQENLFKKVKEKQSGGRKEREREKSQ
jgi:hypothetical protein